MMNKWVYRGHVYKIISLVEILVIYMYAAAAAAAAAGE